ncbi:MAG: sugar ABC transporter substrate-binding protein [Planctomycetes bacterium]|nr:sugar ABC transporter substrate-binding protein [Planctomycetota bacterium]
MGKILALAIYLVLVSVIFLTGCAKLDEEDARKVVLRYSAYGYPVYDRFREEDARKFEKIHPEVEIRYEPIAGGGYNSKILSQLASDTAPDLFFLPYETPVELARKGVLLDLTPFIEKDKSFFDEIYPQLIENQKYNGRIYALPNNANLDVIYYNKKLFNEVGLPYPNREWTWQDMLEAAQRLTKVNNQGRVTQFGLIPYHQKTFIIQNGGHFWNEDKDRSTLNSPEVVNALQFYKDLSYRYHVSPTHSEGEYQGSIEMFSSGKVAMLGGGRWLTATLQIEKTGELDWGVAPLPRGKKRSTRLSFNCFGVWVKSKYPDLVFELAKFLIRPEGIRFLIETGDSVPIRTSGENIDFFLNQPGRPTGENQVYLDSFKYCFTISEMEINHRIPYDQQCEIVTRHIEYFMAGEKTAEEAVKDMENELNVLLYRKG